MPKKESPKKTESKLTPAEEAKVEGNNYYKNLTKQLKMISLVVDSEILWEEWEEWGEWVEWEDLAVWEWVVWVECNSSPQCLVAVICVEVAEHQKVFKLQLL